MNLQANKLKRGGKFEGELGLEGFERNLIGELKGKGKIMG